jgi:hypothetical protein
LTSDTTTDAGGAPGRGPRRTVARDWLFGYAPRRYLLTELYGPGGLSEELSENGLSAAQLAALGGKCRSGAKSDIAALEELGLIRSQRFGRRDRYFPIKECELARALCLLIESIERLDSSAGS